MIREPPELLLNAYFSEFSHLIRDYTNQNGHCNESVDKLLQSVPKMALLLSAEAFSISE